MVTTTGDALNAAIAKALLDARGDVTYDTLALETGISSRQLKRLLHDEQEMKTADFRRISLALGVNGGQLLDEIDAGLK